MRRITLDHSHALIHQDELNIYTAKVSLYHDMIHAGTGAGSDFLGWVELPDNYDREELARIKAAADKIRQEAEIFIVVGIGGSYLGARAAIEMLSHTFRNELPSEKRNGPRIYYVGQNLSATYISHLLEAIEGQDVCLNVISKSGTTTEPAIAFQILKQWMERQYGREEAAQRIYVTTDKRKGILRELADREGYASFVIPDNVGGRYSVLTAVGLLPMAVAGIDLDEVLAGARAAANDLRGDRLQDNPCYQYAAIRNLLHAQGKTTEIMVNYEPRLFYFGEWFKQLFGESEGKEGKGIFPASLNFTTDLHSMGQYIQQGRRDIFETVLKVEKSPAEIILDKADEDLGLNYLAGRTMGFVNDKAFAGTLQAHVDGGVPNLVIHIPETSPYYFGYMVYFFEKACAMSAYLLGVNPFDQPGVEAYKKNMKQLLKATNT